MYGFVYFWSMLGNIKALLYLLTVMTIIYRIPLALSGVGRLSPHHDS